MNNIQRKHIITIIIVIAVGIASVGTLFLFIPELIQPTPETRTIEDMAGNKIIIPYNVERVATGRPILVEVLMALGAQDKLVAFSDANSLHWMREVFPGIVNVSKGFTYTDVIIEELIKINPDVVFTCIGDKTTDPIRAAGIPVVETAKFTDEEIKQMVLTIGLTLGEDEYRRAHEYAQYYDTKMNLVVERTQNLMSTEKPGVLYLNSVSPDLRAYGCKATLNNYIEKAGGINVAADITLDGGVGTITAEHLLTYDPDFIFVNVPKEDFDIFLVDPRWQQQKAIKNGNANITPRGVWSWGYGQGSIPLLIVWIAKNIQPTLFTDIDFNDELKYYFIHFFGYELSDDGVYRIMNALPPE